MNRRVRLLLLGALALALVALVGAGVFLASDRNEQPRQLGGVQAGLGPGALEVKRGARAPDLSGTSPITGERVSLSDFAGKPVVINVWASWCPPCRAEAPDIKRFVDAHPEAVMLGIDFQDDTGGARDFYREFDWTHPSIADPDGSLAANVGLVGLPTTIFLDAAHREVARVVGEIDRAGLEEGLRVAKRAG